MPCPALFGFEVSLSTSNQVLIKLSDFLQMSLKMGFFPLSLFFLHAQLSLPPRSGRQFMTIITLLLPNSQRRFDSCDINVPLKLIQSIIKCLVISDV